MKMAISKFSNELARMYSLKSFLNSNLKKKIGLILPFRTLGEG